MDALNGQNLEQSAPYRRLNLISDQRELIDNLEGLNSVDDLPQSACNVARRALTGACHSLYQVPNDFTADHFGVLTSVEALHVDQMQAVLVELEGTHKDFL